MGLRPARDHTLEHVGEPRLRLNSLQRPGCLENYRIPLAKSDRVRSATFVSCRSLGQWVGSGRLRATWQGSGGEASAREMPLSASLATSPTVSDRLREDGEAAAGKLVRHAGRTPETIF